MERSLAEARAKLDKQAEKSKLEAEALERQAAEDYNQLFQAHREEMERLHERHQKQAREAEERLKQAQEELSYSKQIATAAVTAQRRLAVRVASLEAELDEMTTQQSSVGPSTPSSSLPSQGTSHAATAPPPRRRSSPPLSSSLVPPAEPKEMLSLQTARQVEPRLFDDLAPSPPLQSSALHPSTVPVPPPLLPTNLVTPRRHAPATRDGGRTAKLKRLHLLDKLNQSA